MNAPDLKQLELTLGSNAQFLTMAKDGLNFFNALDPGSDVDNSWPSSKRLRMQVLVPYSVIKLTLLHQDWSLQALIQFSFEDTYSAPLT